MKSIFAKNIFAFIISVIVSCVIGVVVQLKISYAYEVLGIDLFKTMLTALAGIPTFVILGKRDNIAEILSVVLFIIIAIVGGTNTLARFYF